MRTIDFDARNEPGVLKSVRGSLLSLRRLLGFELRQPLKNVAPALEELSVFSEHHIEHIAHYLLYAGANMNLRLLSIHFDAHFPSHVMKVFKYFPVLEVLHLTWRLNGVDLAQDLEVNLVTNEGNLDSLSGMNHFSLHVLWTEHAP